MSLAPEPRPSFGERLARAFVTFVRALATLLLIVLILGGVGALAYYGVPYLYRHYIQPVEETQTRVQALESNTTQELQRLTQRVQRLEDQNAQLQQRLDDLLGQLDEQSTRLDALSTQVETQGETLTRLDDLQSQIEALQSALETTQGDLTAVQQALEDNAPLVKLQRQLQVLRAMEHLTRARVYLLQSNFGLAKEEVARAQAVLQDLASQASDLPLAEPLQRLETALRNLPGRPVVAAEDLEIAWRLLNEALPPVATSTPAAETTPEATPTPTPTPTP